MNSTIKKIILLLDEFKSTKNIDVLRQAAERIDEMQPMGVLNFKKRQEARFNKLELWLLLLDQIDQQADPHFKPENFPSPASNEEKSIHFHYQINLRKLDTWSTPRVETFIRQCYLKSPKSRNELGNAVAKNISMPARQTRLNDLLA